MGGVKQEVASVCVKYEYIHWQWHFLCMSDKLACWSSVAQTQQNLLLESS